MGVDIHAHKLELLPANTRLDSVATVVRRMENALKKTEETGKYHPYAYKWKCEQETLDWVEEHWPQRTAGLSAGVYECTTLEPHLATAYSHYNNIRNGLAKLVGWQSQEDFWDNAEEDEAFFELIDFSDSQGIIGRIACKALAQDFVDWQERAEAFSNHDAFFDYYQILASIFAAAAEVDGIVTFS
jgi:hypothetical protein